MAENDIETRRKTPRLNSLPRMLSTTKTGLSSWASNAGPRSAGVIELIRIFGDRTKRAARTSEYGPETREAKPNASSSGLSPPLRPKILASARTTVHERTIDVSTSPVNRPKAEIEAHITPRHASSFVTREIASIKVREILISRAAANTRRRPSAGRF